MPEDVREVRNEGWMWPKSSRRAHYFRRVDEKHAAVAICNNGHVAWLDKYTRAWRDDLAKKLESFHCKDCLKEMLPETRPK